MTDQDAAGPESQPREYNPGDSLKKLQRSIHSWSLSKGWWDGFPTGDASRAIDLQRIVNDEKGATEFTPVDLDLDASNYIAAKLALVHSECSEGLEALRDGDLALRIAEGGKPEGLESELTDVIIRVLDLAQALGMDMGETVAKKMLYNESRSKRHGGRRL